MKIVSETPEEEIKARELDKKKRHAEEAAREAIRAHAANVLRIVRGAGKTHELAQGMADCLKAFQAYYDVHGHDPSRHANRWLDPDIAWHQSRPWIMKGRVDKYPTDRESAEITVRKGALQVAASMLVDDASQHSAGTFEMRGGIRDFHEAIEEEERERKYPTTFSGMMAREARIKESKRKTKPTK